MQNEHLQKKDNSQTEEILQDLVNIAFSSGIESAVAKARKMNDPYILDAFHDLLVDRLYKELVKRGKLKEL